MATKFANPLGGEGQSGAGATSPEQVATNAAATEWVLTDGDLTAVDDVLAAHRS